MCKNVAIEAGPLAGLQKLLIEGLHVSIFAGFLID